jgi:uncharacterized protein
MIRSMVFSLILALGSVPNAGAQLREEAVELSVSNATLHGTLMVPPKPGPYVVALIIAGSGPTDRNGNSPMLAGPNNSLKLIAEGLAEAGIASLRYDKRGIGASKGSGSEADLRFTTFSDDAVALIRMLRGDKRFSKVVVIGHSEGALLGTIAARQADADGLVLLAGVGRPIADVLREQLRAGIPALADSAERVLGELAAGRTVADVPAALQMIFRPSVQPYMMSWLPLDPKAELARVRAPRLVVQGTTDVQVSLADARRLAEAQSVELEIIEGMNHVLKRANGSAQEQLASSYVDPKLPLAEGLMPAIVRFIESRVQAM